MDEDAEAKLPVLQFVCHFETLVETSQTKASDVNCQEPYGLYRCCNSLALQREKLARREVTYFVQHAPGVSNTCPKTFILHTNAYHKLAKRLATFRYCLLVASSLVVIQIVP